MWFIKSKKVILTLAAMVLITVGTITISDTNRLGWFIGVIASLAGCYSIGQGIADGASGGRTSSSSGPKGEDKLPPTTPA